jgi:hypothetical protein
MWNNITREGIKDDKREMKESIKREGKNSPSAKVFTFDRTSHTVRFWSILISFLGVRPNLKL